MNGAVDVRKEIEFQITRVKREVDHARDAGDYSRAQNLSDQLTSLKRLLHEVK